jgi:diaminopimelate decarboxylase
VDHEADRPSPATYPYYQAVTRGEWLRQILSAPAGSDGGTVADELRVRQIELRCEPGRSLLDGCGMTIAQVAFRKHPGALDLGGLPARPDLDQAFASTRRVRVLV